MFTSPGSIAFRFLSFDIYWYGIIIAFAMFVSLIVILTIRKKYYSDIPEDNIFDISLLLIISGIICARIYYVILDWQYFSSHPSLIPCIWNGGISIHGAIIGGIIVSYLYIKKKKVNFLKYADLFSFGIVTGQIIGRWGNFFNSEAYGLPCDLPWKLYIPYEFRPAFYKGYQYFHPAFLYESLANTLLLGIMLYILIKKPNRKTGTIFFLYIILYGIIRNLIENIRIDSVLNLLNGVHFANIASLVFIIFGFAGLYYIHSKKA
ncbi:MAG: prolipoprotein diacylglyceryl transferase [Candidatus Avigastranaerophilus sp.]